MTKTLQKFSLKLWLGTACVMFIFGTTFPLNVAAQTTNTFPASGNTGIGTTTPGSLLEVKQSQNAGTTVVVDNGHTAASNGAYSGFFFKQAGANRFFFGSLNDGNTTQFGGAGGVQFWNFANGPMLFATNSAERMRIDAAGNVGISTANPATALEVGRNVAGTPSGLTITGGSTVAAPVLYFNYADAGSNLKRWLTYSDINGGFNVATQPDAGGAASTKLFISNAGNVGIGTITPAAKLEVAGNINVTGTGPNAGNINISGTINAKYQDVAEWVESSQALSAGTVVVLDHTRSNQVVASSKAYDTRVAGVISLQPGIALGESGAGKVLVATTGRVKIKVDASAGPIQIGDLLVTSDKEGVAKKSEPLMLGGAQIHRPGTLIGKALEPLAKGTGEILVLLSLQ